MHKKSNHIGRLQCAECNFHTDEKDLMKKHCDDIHNNPENSMLPNNDTEETVENTFDNTTVCGK